MVLDTSLLNAQQYKVHIKSKVEQSRERSSSYWKGSLLVALDYSRQLYFLCQHVVKNMSLQFRQNQVPSKIQKQKKKNLKCYFANTLFNPPSPPQKNNVQRIIPLEVILLNILMKRSPMRKKICLKCWHFDLHSVPSVI